MTTLSRSKASANVPSGPRGNFFVGQLLDFNRDPLSLITQCVREYGDFVRLRLGPFSTYLISDPAMIASVIDDKTGLFVRARNARSVRNLIGNGLVTSEGTYWQRQRRIIQPAFHREQIAAAANTVTSYTDNILNEHWQEGKIYNIDQKLVSLTMAIVGKTLFDVDVRDKIDAIGHAMEVAVHHYEVRSSNMFLVPEWLPTSDNVRFRHAVQQMDKIIYDIIQQHRTSSETRQDLLSVLLKLQDEDGVGMTDLQVRDEVMTFILAGHETSAHTLAWTCMLLAQHPEAEAKLVEELETILNNRVPSFADIPNLKYTEWVLLESMRLYPAAWALGREPLRDCQVGQYSLRAGESIIMSQWVVHRDPRIFDDPEVFNPARWANDFAKRLPTYAYFPFGGGHRVCIGKAFAMMEMILILAILFQKLHVELVPEQMIVPNPSMTLYPKYGINVKVSKR